MFMSILIFNKIGVALLFISMSIIPLFTVSSTSEDLVCQWSCCLSSVVVAHSFIFSNKNTVEFP